MPEEFDEFGIPIKKKRQQEVDEFGVPIKKKETGGIGSLFGALSGTGGAGLSASSGIAGKIKTKPTAKPRIEEIEAYNQRFRDITGTKSTQFILGSELPQIKKAREEKDYLKFRQIEDNEINPVLSAVKSGTADPNQLKELYNKPYGKRVVQSAIEEIMPGASQYGLDADVVGSDRNWQEIAAKIQETNRSKGVESSNQQEAELNNELSNDFKTFTYGNERIGIEGKDEAVMKVDKNSFGEIDPNSFTDLEDARKKILKADKVWGANGVETDKKSLLKKIEARQFQLKAQEQLPKEIVSNAAMIKDAVSKVPVEWKRKGGNPELAAKDAEYVMEGLNYIRDSAPGEYNMIMASMAAVGKMSEQQYQDLVMLGRDINYYRKFKAGEYVEQDTRSFMTPQVKKANLAGWLSQRLKEKRKSVNTFKVSDKDILEAYKDAPEELKDDELLYELRRQEAVGAGGKGIRKTGGIYEFYHGIASPLKSVANTFDVAFDNPFKAYLKSKELDRGDQKIPQKGGGFGEDLPSNTWLNKAVGGFGSFLSQLMLARGIGSVTSGAGNTLLSMTAPRAATLTTGGMALKVGTPLSTLAQTYGDEYIDFLEKTGSPAKAGFGAFVSGLAQGYIERFVMPDVKIADNIGLLTSKKNFARDIINVVEKGGGKAEIGKVVRDFVYNTGKTLFKEAILEENLQNFVNAITEQIISPKTAADRDLMQEIADVSSQSVTAMAIPSLLGGAGETKVQRGLNKAQLHHIGVNYKTYQEALDRQLARGLMSKQDHEQASNIIQLHGQNVNNAPVRDANGELISAARQLEYAYQSTVAEVAAQQAAKQPDKIQREPLEKKVEEADKIKRQIFYGEDDAKLPPKKDEPIVIDQDRDLMDEEEGSEFTSRPKEEILVDVPAAATAIEDVNVRNQILSNPERGLAEIAQQLHSTEGEASTATKVFGRDLSDLALELYPTREDADAALQQAAQPQIDQQRDLDMGTEPVSEMPSISVQMPEIVEHQTAETTTHTAPQAEAAETLQAEPPPSGEKLVEEVPPGEPPLPPKAAEKESGESRDKGVLNRLYEAKNVPQAAKEGFEREGLEYQTSNQEEAAAVAKAVIESEGMDEAVRLASEQKFDGDVNSLILAESLNQLAIQEEKAATSAEKIAKAERFAEIAILYDKMARTAGRFNSAINYFYKKSPLGMIIKENADRKDNFNKWAKPKDKSWKDFFADMMKEPDFAELVKSEVKAERAALRAARKEKVHKAIDEAAEKWANKLSAKLPEGTQRQGIDGVKVLKAVAASMKAAYDAGESVAKIVQDAIDYISEKLGTTDWNSEEFRKEWEVKLAEREYKSSADFHEKRIARLKEELERVKFRKKKTPKESKTSTREIPADEQFILDEIEAEQQKWDEEIDAARKAADDYQKMETERNRQLKKIQEITEKIEVLKSGKLPDAKKKVEKNDVQEIEDLKAEKDNLEKQVRESIAQEKKMKELEQELQRLKDRKAKDKSTKNAKDITDAERQIRSEIETERKAWKIEKNIDRLNEELQRVKNRQKKAVFLKEKRELTEVEKNILAEIKFEKEKWANEIAPEKKAIADLKAAQKSLEEYQRRINEKDISGRVVVESNDPRVIELRAKRDAKRKEYEEMKRKMTRPTEEELRQKALDKFRKKLKGLTEEQKDEVIRKSYAKIIENGGLDYEDFRKLIAEATGRGDLTEEQKNQIKKLIHDTNVVDDFGKRYREQKTQKSKDAYKKAQERAALAARDLADMFDKKQDILRLLVTAMQGSTISLTNALLLNPAFNVINQWAIRLPNAIIQTVIDLGLRMFNKDYRGTYSTVFNQRSFFKQLGVGTSEAVKQIATGLNRQDYNAKEIYPNQIRPMKALRSLRTEKLTFRQKVHRVLQIFPGTPAEIIFRVLNLGDKPMRFGADGAQASAFAKSLGIKPTNIDFDIFMEFPREEAYRILRERGLSEKEAGDKADAIRDAIVQEGKRSTFQQDNIFVDAINKGFGETGIGMLGKATLISPYIKIPSNAFWSFFNIVHPTIALTQATGHMIAAKNAKAKGDDVKAMKQAREARYWLGHAAVGVGWNAAIIPLVKLGIIAAGYSDDESKKEREGEMTYEPQGTLNVTKLFAFLRGENPDDVKESFTVNLKWFGSLGMFMNAKARDWEEMDEEQRENRDLLTTNLLSLWDTDDLSEMQNSVFSNASSLFGALGEGGYSANKYFLNQINMVANLVQPATIAQINRAQMPYYTQGKSDSFAKELDNAFAQRSWLYRKLTGSYPRAKINIWGEPLKKDGSVWNRVLGFNKVTKDNFAQPLYEDAKKYNDPGFFPAAVTNKLEGQTLTAEQETKRKEFVGAARKALIAPFINDGAAFPIVGKKYSELTPEQKKAAIEYFSAVGREQGDAQLFLIYPELKPKTRTIQEEVSDDLFKAALELMKMKSE